MTQSPSTAMLDLLRTRRSVGPAFLSYPGPSKLELATILTIAARVPDHGKLAPWRFIVFEGGARQKAGEIISSVFGADNPGASAERLQQERLRLAHAPLVVAVVSRAAPHVKIPEWEQLMSAGAAAMNLTIAARAHGFASAWLTEWYAYDRRVLTQLGLAAHEKIAGFLHVGTPTVVPEDRVRPAMDEIITHF